MPSKHTAADCLEDIIENAVRIAAYVADLNRDSFARTGLVRDAVERCLERVCEAAVRLGPQAPALMPAQPWSDIRGMGNRLRHAYDRLDIDLLWVTVTDRVPALERDATLALDRLKRPDIG